jgi:hypothetical protein
MSEAAPAEPMTFVVFIALENDAFQPAPQREIVRLLDEIRQALLRGRDGGGVVDLNGNKVGSWSLGFEAGE